MKFESEILLTGTRLEIAVSATKHSVGGRSNNRRVGGGIFADPRRIGIPSEQGKPRGPVRLAPRGPLQKMIEAGIITSSVEPVPLARAIPVRASSRIMNHELKVTDSNLPPGLEIDAND
jgi:hypothetical protein